jgi:hypothetical protein
LGCFGTILVFGFLAAIILFVTAVIYAIVGLWPMRAPYAVIGMGPLKRFADSGSYETLLRTVIAERIELVKANGKINGNKLGLYASAALFTVIGLIVLTVVILSLAIAFAVAPQKLLKTDAQGDSNAVVSYYRILERQPFKQSKHKTVARSTAK